MMAERRVALISDAAGYVGPSLARLLAPLHDLSCPQSADHRAPVPRRSTARNPSACVHSLFDRSTDDLRYARPIAV